MAYAIENSVKNKATTSRMQCIDLCLLISSPRSLQNDFLSRLMLYLMNAQLKKNQTTSATIKLTRDVSW